MSHSFNSDQTNKLRSMVKSKLIEIGEYVDDQLTDYVMIMVTNKKTEKQMADDLELFLGGKEQSTKFSSWLHSAINSLTHGHSDHSHRKLSSNSSSYKNPSSKSATKISTNIDTTDELAIQIETNEFNEDFNEEKSNQINKSIPKDKKDLSFTEIESTESSENKKSTVKTSQSNASSVPLTSQKYISSCIGAVISRDKKDNHSSLSRLDRDKTERDKESISRRTRRPSRDQEMMDEDELEDDDYKSNKPRLSSIIKVSERKYSIPKSMQPNKQILLKAVDDANNSVTKTRRSDGDFKDGDSHSPSSRIIKTKNSDNKLELFSKHYYNTNKRNEENGNHKRLRTSRNLSNDEIINRDEKIEFSIVSDKRQVQIFDDNDNSALRQVDTNAKRELIIVENEEARVALTNNQASEPKFIVTLTGVNEEKILNNKRSYSEMLNDETDYAMDDSKQHELQQMDMDDDNEATGLIKKKLIRCTFWPMCEKGDLCPFLHPNKPCTAFPNCQFGQLCHYLHPSCRYDGFCTRLDCPYTHVIKKPVANSAPTKSTSLDTQTPAVSVQQQTTTFSSSSSEQIAAQINTPSTNNGSGPKITINKIQPLYSLVNNNQSSPDSALKTAPVRHSNPFSYKPASAVIHAPSQYALINRPTAANTLQTNCKYGNLCKNPKCIYTHPILPQKSQLKWTATPTSNSSNAPSTNNILIQSQSEQHESAESMANNNSNNNQTMILSN